MTVVLEPRLTQLDERVLAALDGRGVRADAVAARVYRGWEDRAGSSWSWQRALAAQQLEEVRGVLRGLEHLGRASGRGGWWRAA